ncbi:MAG: transcriptional repressor [Bacteroidota bacterium]
MHTESRHILKNHDLRLTEARERILDLFLHEERALSHADIEAGLGADADRVTVYRTLRTFADKGILHTIPDEQDNIRYALCHHGSCGPENHRHNHIHFKCGQCGQTQCLEGLVIPSVVLPAGFIFLEANYIIQGICDRCAANAAQN